MLLPRLAGGGAERVIMDIGKALSDRNYNVDLVLYEKDGPYLDELNGTLNVIDLGSGPGIINRICHINKLRRYLYDKKPAVLLSTLSRTNQDAAIVSYLSSAPVQVVLRVSNMLTKDGKCLKGRLRLKQSLYSLSDSIVAVSEGVKKNIIDELHVKEEKVKVIYNPLRRNVTKRARESVDHPWLTTCSMPVFLAVGSLSPQKDFRTLIHAFARVRKRMAARLIILGTGPQRNKLFNIVSQLGLKNDVDIHGFEVNPFPYMKHADVLVLSSAWEGLPNVLIEAMALGTPVVSTKCPSGPEEILQNGKYGPLVPVGDDTELAEAMLHTLSCPIDEERLIERAQEFSIENILPQYASVMGLNNFNRQ